jgi:hypothetical protein
MSVVCEFVNWFIAEEIWGWFNEINGSYMAHSLFTVHIVHNVRTLHTVHNVYMEYILHTAHSVHTVHTQVYTIDSVNHLYQYL